VSGERSKARYFVQRADRNTVVHVCKFYVEKKNNPYCEELRMEKKPCDRGKSDKKKK